MCRHIKAQHVSRADGTRRVPATFDLEEVVERVAAVAGQLKRTVRHHLLVVDRRQGRSLCELSLGCPQPAPVGRWSQLKHITGRLVLNLNLELVWKLSFAIWPLCLVVCTMKSAKLRVCSCNAIETG